jgi:hypothetical protein
LPGERINYINKRGKGLPGERINYINKRGKGYSNSFGDNDEEGEGLFYSGVPISAQTGGCMNCDEEGEGLFYSGIPISAQTGGKNKHHEEEEKKGRKLNLNLSSKKALQNGSGLMLY